MAGALAQRIKRWTRITRLAVHVARGLLISTFLFPLQSSERRKREVEHWSMQLLALLNVRIFLHGKPPAYRARPLMIVANHVSWLDIFAINAVVPSRFIAKSEIRRWPVVGWLCARTGTVFIERSRRHDTARINSMVTDALRSGDAFVVFPEGTTTDGTTLLKFHASLLEPALECNAAVQPVAIGYDRSDGTLCSEAAFDEGKSMWDSLMAITSQHEIIVHVCFLEPILPDGRHRRDIAAQAREAILLTLYPAARYSRTEEAAGQEAVLH